MRAKTLFIFLLICLFAVSVKAQDNHRGDSIELKIIPLGAMKFYQNDSRVSLGVVTGLMRNNPEAFKYINKSKTNNTIGFITGFIGGLLVGYEIGTAIAGKDINWSVMGAGAGFIVVTIPLDIAAKRNARKAVHLYNAAYR
jgi:hypothetical protein